MDNFFTKMFHRREVSGNGTPGTITTTDPKAAENQGTATADEDIDIVAGRTYVIWAQRTPSGGSMNFIKNVKAVTTVILKKAEGLIKMKVDGSPITRGIPTASGDYKLEFYTYGDGYMHLVWTKLEVFS